MLRLPNTQNPKTLPNKKIPITYAELTEPDAVEKVMARAKGMRTLFDTSTDGTPDADAVLYTPVTEPVPALAELWQSVAAEVEMKNAQTSQSTDLVPTMISYRNLSEHEKNRVLAYLAAMLASGTKLVKVAADFFLWIYEKAMQQYRAVEKALNSAKKGGGNTEQTLHELPPKPVQRVCGVTSATIEGLQQYVEAHPRGALIKKDELCGILGEMNRNKMDGESGDWLSGYSGAPVNTLRKTAAKISVREAFWSIVGGATPEAFRAQLQKANRTSDGTLSRFCLVWPPDKREFSREDVSDEAIKRMEVIMTILLAIDFVDGRPYVVSLSPEAEARWCAWGQELKDKSFTTDDNTVTSFYGKAEELLARIALILHLLESVAEALPEDISNMDDFPKNLETLIPREISGETMQRAEIATRWIMAETFENYRKFRFVQPQDISEEVVEILRKNGKPMSVRDIGQKKRCYRSGEGKTKLEKAIDKLVKAGRLQCQTTKVGNGKAVLKYSIPPAQAG